ncbi:LexA family transcriptional regulator [Aliarcobacter butzleri]|uniref:LexA family transcriptional regulator n=1 Tax=Aliarcobacter butzleri TaxID=28197 RepID=UPI00215B6AF3|nr:LexA family transcriptional regulator [Aliarcobacter butzleri]MCR8709852.1 helix-turn-helix domain-containing protein [Aliarcobacter butzleri]
MLNTIINLLQENNKKQADLAKFLDIPTGNLSNILQGNGRKFSAEQIALIAKYFSVTTDYIYGLENKKSVKPVPVIGTASCGGCDINHLQESGKTAFYNGEFWKSSLYCVIANGDSMSPEIDDGDEVIIDPDVKSQHGDMVYYKIDAESAIKVLVIDKEAHIMQFVPYNPNECFKTKTIRLDDEETLNKLIYHKVVSVNKLKFNNRAARLKMINRV